MKGSIACMAVLLALAAGCTTFPRPADDSAVPRTEPPAAETPAIRTGRGGFAMPDVTMLDTWNAVGQILVRLDGVTYQGRSQMLGLYDVRYRGEPLLIVTRGRVIQQAGDGLVTDVGALQHDGQPNHSALAVELLDQLQQRLPDELARFEAGER